MGYIFKVTLALHNPFLLLTCKQAQGKIIAKHSKTAPKHICTNWVLSLSPSQDAQAHSKFPSAA